MAETMQTLEELSSLKPADAPQPPKYVQKLDKQGRAYMPTKDKGILGASNNDGPSTLPELAKIRNIPILCVFGADEHDSVCAQSELDTVVDRVRLSGGHHFDGDYRHTADLIVKADKARVAAMDKTK